MGGDRAGRWLKFGLALAVSVVFTALFFLHTDWGEVGDALTGADYAYVVPALALFAGSVAVRAVRWQVLYRPHREIGWPRLLPSLLVGYAGNNLLPLRAGELLRAQHIADGSGVPRMVSFGTFIMERFFDFAVLSSLVLAGVVISGEGSAYIVAGGLLFGATVAGFAVGVYFANHPSRARRMIARPWPLVPETLREEAATLAESFLLGCSCLTHRGRFFGVSLITVVAWALELLMYWVLAAAFDLHAGFFSIAFAGSAANVALSIPAAQGGIGPFDVTAKEALKAFSITGSSVQAYVVALHIFLVAPISVAGLIVLWRSTLPVARGGQAGRLEPVPEMDGSDWRGVV
jgi:uncharacterized protein (TIRG00374 family)